MNVFLLFHAATIRQSDNDSKFTANFITETKKLWPEMKLVCRIPHHMRSMKHANSDKGYPG